MDRRSQVNRHHWREIPAICSVSVRFALFASTLTASFGIAIACGSFEEASEKAEPDGGPSPDGSVVDGGAGDAPATLSTRYRDAVLADQPLAYWRMGKVDGIVVPDETGGNNGLVLGGTGDVATNGEGIFADDRAIRFGGKSGHAIPSVPTAFLFNGNEPYTIELWARRELDTAGDAGSFFQHVVGYVDGYTTPSPSTQNGYLLYLRPSDPPATYAGHGSNVPDAGAIQAGGELVPPGVWAHYAMVFDRISMTLYIDGARKGSVAVKGPLQTRSSPFTIAKASNENNRYFQGSIDEVAVYGRDLDAVSLAKHYALAKGL
jgi:hypothetical protein